MIAVISIDWVEGPIVTIGRTCDGYTYKGEPAWYNTLDGETYQMRYCTVVQELDVETFEEAQEKYPEWFI